MRIWINAIIEIFKTFSFSKILIHPSYILNRLLLNSSFALKLKKSTGKPAYFIIELTNHCNVKCVMCPQPRQTREAGFMSFEFYKSIIDQIYKYAEVVDLDLYGEILLHPQFEEFIAYAKSKNLKTLVSTNIKTLNKKNSLRLINSGLDFITLSLDGVKKETYEAVRVGSDFDKVMENVYTFVKLNNRKIFTSLQIINMKQTHDEVEEFVEKFKTLNVDVVRVIPYSSHDPEKKDLNCDFNYPKSENHCAFLWRTMVVTWNGKIVPCCQDWDNNIVLGDLNNESVLDVWNGQKMTTMRGKHAEKDRTDYAICQGCDTFNPSKITMLASSAIDDYNANKILPILQKTYILSNILKKK